MCGIAGYIGTKVAQPILLDTLARLEYRGYDSCGIAVRGSPLTICKGTTRVSKLKLQSPELSGTVGIGHTRWATHGEVSEANAHPQTDCRHKIAVVHNGVISNFHELRRILVAEGHIFKSQTDTEVLPHLIEKFYDGDLEHAVRQALSLVEGTYAILVVTEYENKMVAARNGSPMIIGIGHDGFVVASDVPAIVNYATKVIYLEDGDLALMDNQDLRITNGSTIVHRTAYDFKIDVETLGKKGFEHYMLKEICEQPQVVRSSLQIYRNQPGFTDKPVLNLETDSLTITACGTSYHAALIGKFVIEELTGIPVRVEVASEISYRPNIVKTSKVIGVSQSGETADVLTSLKRMKAAGVETIAITNAFQSTISRVADHTIYTPAGHEVAVAATKTFVAQVVALIKLALSHPKVSRDIRDRLDTELDLIPQKIQRIIDNKIQIEHYASFLSGVEQIFFIAKGVNVPIAFEGALKAKEIGYINAEAFCAGELKHGPFALLTPASMVVIIAPRDENHSSISTTVQEIKARKAKVICVVEEEDDTFDDSVENILKIPSTERLLSPILYAVALQLLAYYIAKTRGCPIDFPRNLAKSVTVE